MINADTLLTLAEVAAGLIGFAAVASVFLGRSKIHQLDLIRFQMIVLIGLQVVFGSFVPFWVVDLSGSTKYLWAGKCSEKVTTKDVNLSGLVCHFLSYFFCYIKYSFPITFAT